MDSDSGDVPPVGGPSLHTSLHLLVLPWRWWNEQFPCYGDENTRLVWFGPSG